MPSQPRLSHAWPVRRNTGDGLARGPCPSAITLSLTTADRNKLARISKRLHLAFHTLISATPRSSSASSGATVNRMNDLCETLMRISVAESRYQMIQTELRQLRLRSARASQPEAIKRYEARIALLKAEAASLIH